MNAINPTIDEVSERTQEYVDAWFSNEEPTSTEATKATKKQETELQKIILQFSRWYGNEPWIKSTMKHDDILNVVYIYAPLFSNHAIEYLSCGHTYGISAVSREMLQLTIHMNIWR